MAYVAARVAPYKKLRAVEIIDPIPKSPSGRSCVECWSSAKLQRLIPQRARWPRPAPFVAPTFTHSTLNVKAGRRDGNYLLLTNPAPITGNTLASEAAPAGTAPGTGHAGQHADPRHALCGRR